MKTLDDKKVVVADIVEKLNSSNHFYVVDIASLNAADTSNLRRKCFERGIVLVVVKKALLKKALEQIDGNFEALYPTLKGSTSLMLCDVANVPAKLIKDLRNMRKEKPLIKSAYVEECIYLGDASLDALATLKSKNELIGDVIGILQSPIKTVLGQLQSGKNIIGGVVKTLQDRAN